jgi:predicted  nucleic acid-binding Zn-ribbon protein
MQPKVTAYALAARADLEKRLKLVEGDLASMHANWNAACQDIAQRDERIRDFEAALLHANACVDAAEARIPDLQIAFDLAKQRADEAEARVKELEKALDPYDQSLLKQRDTLRTRVAELEEKLMVMCVAQINESVSMTDEQIRNIFKGWEPLPISTMDELIEWSRHIIKAAAQSLPSPASPAPAPLAAQGVEGEPHHER